MIGLDDKGIAEAVNRVYRSTTGTYQVNLADRTIAKDQLKKVAEWGNEPCPHVSHTRGKHWCGECWEALLDEVK